ncbi:MAG TPA: hypothetical protein PKJ63_10870 [Cyclobacteriaceae bacterium]|nr:hypothetical protein [Cyclobacteriaceae bacterium]
MILRSPREQSNNDKSTINPKVTENEPEDKGKSRPLKTKQQQPEKVDRRRKKDKKVIFTNSMRGTLLQEIHQTIDKYRKKVDVDYNLAKFLEEASQQQLKQLQSKIS